MLQMQRFPAELFDANCYVVWSGKEVLVVDPGAGITAPVVEFLEYEGLQLASVLLTHGHADHVWEAAPLVSAAQAANVASSRVPVYITGPDRYFLQDPAGALGLSAANLDVVPWEIPVNVQQIDDLSFEPAANVHLRAIPAPGHSPGSAVFLVASADNGPGDLKAFSGDVVFAGSVGRTDLPGGDEDEMRQSLRTLCNVLDPRTTLYPGHGPHTTWQKELDTNAYVRRARRIG